MTEHDAILVETVARHFEHSATRDDEVAIGFADVRVRCAFDSVRPFGSYQAAALFFELRAPRLAPDGVFASMSGYAPTPEAAIVEGGCLWTCSFAPVLRASLAGTDEPNVACFDAVSGGRRFRVFVDALDRGIITSPDGGDSDQRYISARARFASDTWLARDVLASGRVPPLPTDRASVLGVFVADMPAKRVVEVKLDGQDLRDMDSIFAAAAPEPPGAITMLRELAVAVPADR